MKKEDEKNSMMGIKITREEATQIHKDHMNLPMQQVTICYAGQWYDIRHLTKLELEDFITFLIK